MRGQRLDERIWLLIIAGAALLLYHRTFAYFWLQWREEPRYSLGWLVLFVSGYLAWKKWPQVRMAERSPSSMGLLVIMIAVVFHLVGSLLDISGPSSLSILLYLVGCCVYLHGPALLRTLAFPLAFLVFAIPFPGGVTDVIGFPLQLWASGTAAFLLRMTGLEIVRNGVNLAIPGFDMQVAEACSGMSSLVALSGVAAVFAYLTRLSQTQKWLIFLLSVPIAFSANVVRIVTIALVGYTWGPEVATTAYHKWSSPLLFAAAIAMLVLINGVFEWLNARGTT